MSHHLPHCCFNLETIVEMSEHICAFCGVAEAAGTAVATSCLILKIRIALISGAKKIQRFRLVNTAAKTFLERSGERQLLASVIREENDSTLYGKCICM